MQTPARSDTRLGRLARFCYSRRKLVLWTWIVALVVISVASQVVGAKYANKFGAGNSETARAQALLAKEFPAASGDIAQVVVHTQDPLTNPGVAADVGTLATALQALPHVSSVISPLTPAGQAQVSRDGLTSFLSVQFDKPSSDLPKAAITAVIDRAKAEQHAGFEVELGGAPIDLVEFAVPGASASIGIVAAIIILLFAFGSAVAMGLPILVALFGLGIGIGVLAFISRFVNTPTFAPDLAIMIGLGVGIDYALFIVTRYREGLKHGLDPAAAVELSLTTSGRAVLFAGTTVVISLFGLLFMGQPFVVGLALGAIATVILVLIGTVTLLPALLGYAGLAIDRARMPKFLRRDHPIGHKTLAYRWSREIQRHSWLAVIGSLALLVVMAIPLFSMRLSFTDDSNAPANLTTRKAYDLLAAAFGPGSNGPLVIAVNLPAGANLAALTTLQADIQAAPDVAFVTPPTLNNPQDPTAARLIAIPKSAPQDARTQDLVRHLRQDVIPSSLKGTSIEALVGGFTAGGIDSSAELTARLPLVIGLVVGLSFLLLMAVFRSIAVPVKAAIMNMLSIGASYGVVVAVFQWGWGGSIIGIGKTGPIDPWVPLFLFTILFGLSMDYEVFLLSRIREEWLRTGDNATSVADGLAATARVITAAAAIMVCVFASFIIKDPLRVLKLFGLGLATAVFVDASLVRMVLVPATMELLGGANWWLPKWLDRILPKVDVEGGVEALEEEPASA